MPKGKATRPSSWPTQKDSHENLYFYPPKQKIHNDNLCLRCWHLRDGVCTKGKDDYCKITKSR